MHGLPAMIARNMLKAVGSLPYSWSFVVCQLLYFIPDCSWRTSRADYGSIIVFQHSVIFGSSMAIYLAKSRLSQIVVLLSFVFASCVQYMEFLVSTMLVEGPITSSPTGAI